MKEHRLFPKIVAGLLAVGGLGALVEREPKQVKAEKTDDVNRETSVGVPLVGTHLKKEHRPEQDSKFCAEHPIEAELRSHNVSVEKMQAALEDASEIVRSNRYGDEKNEAKYFSVCHDTDRWASIQKSIHYASEKTGVPEYVLTAIGLIESQFNEDASRSDTKVYGPYQMTLETAEEAAKDAKECFGFPIEVNSTEDLKETKTAVRLAALRLRALEKRYGQLSLAIMDYAGGRVSLEQKMKEAFPNVDFGEKDWADMQRHHLAERQAQKKRDEMLKQMKQGRGTDHDHQALRQTVHVFEAAGLAYTKAKNSWKEKRAVLPRTLANAGVTVLALYEHEKAKGGDVPHSITYPLALDAIAARAEKHTNMIQ